jgi:hypothetical protein
MARTEQSANRPDHAMRGTPIARFGTTAGGHLGDQLADHIGGYLKSPSKKCR